MQRNNIRRHISVFFTLSQSLFIIPLFLIISCGSVPKSQKNVIPEPLWISDKKAAFPEAEYLAQLGSGQSALEAKNNSIAQLASYFNTNVKSIVQGDTLLLNGPQNQSYVERQINSSVVTSTDLELFALETAEPYYLERESKWYCCAFIERKAAWNQYEPLVRDKKNAFYSLFDLTKAITDPLEKIRAYKNAQPAAEDFITSLYRASMFSKSMTDQVFGQDRALASSIPGFIQQEKDRCRLYVRVTNDYASIVSTSLNKIFNELGFPLTDDAASAYYSLDAVISYDELVQEELLVYHPAIKVSVNSKEKSLYLYENKVDRILSYNESKAKNTACSQLAQLLDREFSADFSNTMGLSE